MRKYATLFCLFATLCALGTGCRSGPTRKDNPPNSASSADTVAGPFHRPAAPLQPNAQIDSEQRLLRGAAFPHGSAATDASAYAWTGNYSLSIDHGPLDDFSRMSIAYSVEVSPDSCVFSGLGYKTYFTILCHTGAANDTLVLYFSKLLEGEDSKRDSVGAPLAKLFRRGGNVFLQSPLVADEDWRYNTPLILKKAPAN